MLTTCLIRFTVSTFLVFAVLLGWTWEASAVTRDARQGCGVTSEDAVARRAQVPAANQAELFKLVVDSNEGVYLELLCGNGTTTGAVHIEVKHDVPNWGDALTAIRNAIVLGKPSPDAETGKTTYSWTFAAGRTMNVVVGDQTIITAYPTDGRDETWIEASTAA